MSPMVVKRVEDSAGMGPLWSNNALSDDEMRKLDIYRMPTPARDGGPEGMNVQRRGRPGEAFKFAFQNDDKVQEWLSRDDRLRLRPLGFSLATYVCPPGTILFGEEQVAFEWRHASRVHVEAL